MHKTMTIDIMQQPPSRTDDMGNRMTPGDWLNPDSIAQHLRNMLPTTIVRYGGSMPTRYWIGWSLDDDGLMWVAHLQFGATPTYLDIKLVPMSEASSQEWAVAYLLFAAEMSHRDWVRAREHRTNEDVETERILRFEPRANLSMEALVEQLAAIRRQLGVEAAARCIASRKQALLERANHLLTLDLKRAREEVANLQKRIEGEARDLATEKRASREARERRNEMEAALHALQKEVATERGGARQRARNRGDLAATHDDMELILRRSDEREATKKLQLRAERAEKRVEELEAERYQAAAAKCATWGDGEREPATEEATDTVAVKLPPDQGITWAKRGAVWHGFGGNPATSDKSACKRMKYAEQVALSEPGAEVDGAICGPCCGEWVMGGRR